MYVDDCKGTISQVHDIDKQLFGVDNSQNMYADVYIHKCKNCKRIWIWYMIETEWHTNAGKWFLGEITQSQLESLTINSVLELLENLPTITYGGGFFNGDINHKVGSFISLHAREK